MNKIYLLTILAGLITIIIIKNALNTKKEALNEYNHFIEIKQKGEEINIINNRINTSLKKLNQLKRFCSIDNNIIKIIKCNNLNKNSFKQVENILFKNYLVLKEFKISENNNSINIMAKIE